MKKIRSMNWGGKRKGAGRPTGTLKNVPRCACGKYTLKSAISGHHRCKVAA